MKTYARIQDGVVAEFIETNGDITEMFHPSLIWVECDGVAGVCAGWMYAGGAFSAPVPTVIHPNQLILSQIAALEATITNRRMREAALGTDGGWLKSIDAEVAALRKGLK